jgi:galactokinase
LQAAEHRLRGANFLIHGEVPLGAGLSSSASLEMAVGMALTSLSGISVPRLELVKLCQAAEHDYVGTRCGIMDQFVVGFGTAGHALLLDCRSLDYQLLPIASDVRMIVCNCMVRHELASGEYNRRRKDCETGVKLLGEHLPGIRALRDVALKDLERNNSLLSERVYHRCRHVVTENERVLAATHALQTRDFEQFGELMYRSHASLRDDYEVSCHELDLLVDLATSAHGVYGARMTGGGFGGCTVNLVRAECVDAFQAHIAAAYRKNIGIEPDIYVCEPAQGAEACTS